MGRKPVLGLAGMFLAGMTLTGCDSTDWCCFGNTKTCTGPTARPAPNWNTPPMNQTQPATPAQSNTGSNRFGTPSTPPVVQPVGGTESSALPGRDSSAAAQPDSFQSSRSPGAAEINPPTPPSSVDRQPVSAVPASNINMNSPLTTRTSAPSTTNIPPLDPPPPLKQPLPPLPPDDPTTTSSSTPATSQPATNFDPPPPPQPVPTKGEGSTQSSSKYQGAPSLDLAPPPPPRNVPPMPGSGPNGN